MLKNLARSCTCAEGQPLVIRVVNGQPVGLEEVWIHFAIPPARAWQIVHQHCAMVLRVGPNGVFTGIVPRKHFTEGVCLYAGSETLASATSGPVTVH